MAIQDERRESLCSVETKQFVRNSLFGEVCWLTNQPKLIADSTTHQIFRQEIAKTIDISPNEVSLVGSAKLGYSLAPGKIFRPFCPGRSDIDIVIASEKLFDEIWDQMVIAHYNGYTQYAADHSKEVFTKFLVLRGNENHKSKYLRSAANSLRNLNRVISEMIRFKAIANYRIYRGWGIAERYHIGGIDLIKREICK